MLFILTAVALVSFGIRTFWLGCVWKFSSLSLLHAFNVVQLPLDPLEVERSGWNGCGTHCAFFNCRMGFHTAVSLGPARS